jgi:hypothetical protein
MSYPGPGLSSYETSRIKHEPPYHPGRPSYSIKREPGYDIKTEYPLTDNRNPDFRFINKLTSIKREGAAVMRPEYPYHHGRKRPAAELAELAEAEEAASYADAVRAPRVRSPFAGPAPADYVHLNYPLVIYGSRLSSLYV